MNVAVMLCVLFVVIGTGALIALSSRNASSPQPLPEVPVASLVNPTQGQLEVYTRRTSPDTRIPVTYCFREGWALANCFATLASGGDYLVYLPGRSGPVSLRNAQRKAAELLGLSPVSPTETPVADAAAAPPPIS